jgi:4-hydroxybenzoate polyprenyltransferase
MLINSLEESKRVDMKASLAKRLYLYQKERFPILVHLPLIAAFSFSAIGFSQACRGVDGFISTQAYLCCVFTNFSLFFVLRVCDEHKDKVDDAKYRTYLPVPRGLVTLSELNVIAIALSVVAVVLNLLFFSALLPFLLLAAGFLFLMRYEFFVPDWLRDRQVLYITSHMIIIPLADMYASSYDWRLSKDPYPLGMLLFFAVSYLNGLVLEIGRKMRVKETEEVGVTSYTNLWGIRKAPLIWLIIVMVNGGLALFAAYWVDYSYYSYILLATTIAFAIVFAFVFLLKPTSKSAKSIEIISLVWALSMYLALGALPLLIQLFS